MSIIDENAGSTGLRRTYADLRRWCSTSLRYAADLVLPPICVHCHAQIVDHGALCASCWSGIDFITPPLCDRLGLPLPYADEAFTISTAAMCDPPAFGRARAAARFGGVMRNLIHAFKYADRHEVSEMFAAMMRAAGAELLCDADILMPVPLHPRKLWKRRYNQAAILAWKLSALSGHPVDVSSLRRSRQTESQAGLPRTERHGNVARAFALASGAAVRLKGKRILLIDDVITTGATLTACTRVLKGAGVTQVDCLAVAMAVGDDNDGHASPDWALF